MSKSFTVAVVGATGLVGREMLAVLDERGFPVTRVIPLSSPNSAGSSVEFGGHEHTVRLATPAAIEDAQLVLMSAGAKASAELAPAFAARGAVVIDNSSQWRRDPQVPLCIPEVNPEALAGLAQKRIIANPNCSTIQMVVALAPLHREAGLKRVIVSTYQAVSGKGKPALDELGEQVTALLSQRDYATRIFPKRIAFNCIPQVDSFEADGFTREEHKMLFETRRILDLPALGVAATCVRVPVFNGHAESVVAEFARPLGVARARELLRGAPGVMLMDEPEHSVYPTQLEAEGTDATFVGRLREDPSAPNSLAFWCVADNLRKGAATNAVQIAELVARDYL